MPVRSVRATLSNNTDFQLTLLGTSLCHGRWTDPQGSWEPSSLQPIPSRNHGAWQSESDGFMTGTEGRVKYLIQNTDVDVNGTPCLSELVYIHWDNPFLWSSDQANHLIDYQVVTTDVKPPCNADQGVWTNPSGGAGSGGLSSQRCRHEIFPAGVNGAGLQGVSWWDALMNWPALLGLTLFREADIHLEFTLGLRKLGSVDETIVDWTSPGATVLATSVDSAVPLVLQDGSMWWIDRSGSVTSIPIGGPLPSQVVGGLDVPTSFAVDGSNIFWFDDDGVGTCDAPACADRRMLAPGQGQGSYGSMVIDHEQVYWSDRDGIFACPRSGCPAGGPVALATGEHTDSTAIHALAVDGANLYFVRLGGSAVSIPKHGGAPLTIATGGPRYPYSVAIDDEAIYWIGCNDVFCSVMRAPLPADRRLRSIR